MGEEKPGKEKGNCEDHSGSQTSKTKFEKSKTGDQREKQETHEKETCSFCSPVDGRRERLAGTKLQHNNTDGRSLMSSLLISLPPVTCDSLLVVVSNFISPNNNTNVFLKRKNEEEETTEERKKEREKQELTIINNVQNRKRSRS